MVSPMGFAQVGEMVEEQPLNPHLGLGANGRATFQHHVHYLFVPRSGGAVEGGEAVPCLGLYIGSLLQQEGHHVGFPPLCSNV